MAGGLGSRLRPLTTAVPKPLLPVVGRPMVEHTLRLLASHGIHDVHMTVQHLSTSIRRYFGDGADLGMEISYVTEHRPLGTAGGVRLGTDTWDEDFLVMSGDAVTDIDLSALLAFHDDRDADLTICLVRRSDPREFGLVEADPDGRVTRFEEKPGWGGVFGDTVSTGIYVVSPRVVRDIPADEESDWSQDVIPRLLAAGRHVAAVVGEGYWEDVGDLPAYRRVQVDALDRRVRLEIPGREVQPGIWAGEGAALSSSAEIEAPVFVGSRSTVESGAHIGAYSVLGSGSIIRASADLDRVVVHDNVYVGSGATLRGCVIGRGCQIGALSRVDEAAVIADDCSLEQEVEVRAGTLVYPGKTVESGGTVEGTVAWDSRGRRRLLARGGASGTVGVDLTPEVAVRLATALTTTLPEDAVVSVAHDGSPSGRAYATAIVGAVSAGGTAVRDLGSMPTPAWRHDAAEHADAGIMARSRADEDDRLDLRIVDAHGHDISETQARHLERIHDRREYRRQRPGKVGAMTCPSGVLEEYAESLGQAIRLDGVGRDSLTVVLDAGAAGRRRVGGDAPLGDVGREVRDLTRGSGDHLRRSSAVDRVLADILLPTGVDLVRLGHRDVAPPGETSSALEELTARVVAHGASLGLAIDELGERLTLVDERGRALTDQRALLVVMDLVAAESGSGHVTLPATASRVAESVAHFHSIGVRRVPSDSAFFPDEGTLLAADGRGGFAIRGCGPYPDAIAAALAIVGLVARTRLTLSAIDERIPRTVLLSEAVEVPWSTRAGVMADVQALAAQREHEAIEGVRIIEPDGAWCLIVPDAREPRILLWAEADADDRARSIAGEWAAVIRQSCDRQARR